MEVDQAAAEKGVKVWNTFSQKYKDIFENFAIQSSVILYSQTRAKNFNRICEVGVGCGQSARMFITSIMKQNAFYFASDLSDEMNKLFYEAHQESDIAFNPKVKLEWIKDVDSIDVAKQVQDMGEDITRKLFVHQANNEKLPYPDESFDLYLSSLSLMLVDNYKNQIAESYRVLEKGGTAGFTVIGRPENCNYLTFIPDILKTLGHEIPLSMSKPITHLSDSESLEKDMREAGFSTVKTFHTKVNIAFEDEKEHLDLIIQAPVFKNILDDFSEDKKEEFLAELNTKWNEKFGPETTDNPEWEILICVVTK